MDLLSSRDDANTDESDSESYGVGNSEEPDAVTRSGQKEKLLRNLKSHNVELRPSDIHGVGVFALASISKDTKMFQFNGEPNPRNISLTQRDINSLPEHVQHKLKSFILPDSDGLYPVPEHGLSCALGVSYYLNNSEDSGKTPNVEFGGKWDASGYTEIIATRGINRDEELVLPPYKMNRSVRDAKRQKTAPDEVQKRSKIQLAKERLVVAKEKADLAKKMAEQNEAMYVAARKGFEVASENREAAEAELKKANMDVRREGFELMLTNGVLPKDHAYRLLKSILIMWMEIESKMYGNRDILCWSTGNNVLRNLVSTVPTSIAKLEGCGVPADVVETYGCRIVKGIKAFIKEWNLQQYIDD